MLGNKYLDNVSQGYQERANAIVGASEAELIREFKPALLSKEDYERYQRDDRTSVRLSMPYSPRVYFDGEGFDVAYFFVRDGKVTTGAAREDVGPPSPTPAGLMGTICPPPG